MSSNQHPFVFTLTRAVQVSTVLWMDNSENTNREESIDQGQTIEGAFSKANAEICGN